MLGAVAIDNREDASETAARIDNQPRCLPERTEVQDSRHRKVERRHEQLFKQQLCQRLRVLISSIRRDAAAYNALLSRQFKLRVKVEKMRRFHGKLTQVKWSTDKDEFDAMIGVKRYYPTN